MAGHLRCKMNEIIADWMSNAFRPTPFDSTRLKLTNRVCRSTDGRFRPDENRQIRHVWSFLSSLATFNLFLLFLLSLLFRLIPFHRSSSSSSTGHPPARRRARFYSFVFFSLSFFFKGEKHISGTPSAVAYDSSQVDVDGEARIPPHNFLLQFLLDTLTKELDPFPILAIRVIKWKYLKQKEFEQLRCWSNKELRNSTEFNNSPSNSISRRDLLPFFFCFNKKKEKKKKKKKYISRFLLSCGLTAPAFVSVLARAASVLCKVASLTIRATVPTDGEKKMLIIFLRVGDMRGIMQ